jgi:hypothetical protein
MGRLGRLPRDAMAGRLPLQSGSLGAVVKPQVVGKVKGRAANFCLFRAFELQAAHRAALPLRAV